MAKGKSDDPCAIADLMLRASFKNILYAIEMSLMSRRNFPFERADVSRRLWPPARRRHGLDIGRAHFCKR